jgi:hypothetical protein
LASERSIRVAGDIRGPARVIGSAFDRAIAANFPFKLTLSGDLAAALREQEGVLFERQIDGRYEGHAAEVVKDPASGSQIKAFVATIRDEVGRFLQALTQDIRRDVLPAPKNIQIRHFVAFNDESDRSGAPVTDDPQSWHHHNADRPSVQGRVSI